jgi:hypothetical protein
VPLRTGRAVAGNMQDVLKDFFPESKKLFITSCHDGAANMVKTLKLLKVESYQHCACSTLVVD